MARKTAAQTAAKTAVKTAVIAAPTRAVTAAGKRTTVVAHLVTGEDMKSALISSDDEPRVEFEGDDPRNQHATVTTDADGVLTWGLFLETAFVDASWRLTLTRAGESEGNAAAEGTTGPQGRVVTSGITEF